MRHGDYEKMNVSYLVMGRAGRNDVFFNAFFVQGRRQPTQSQLSQIYNVDWIDVYETHNIEHRTEPVSH